MADTAFRTKDEVTYEIQFDFVNDIHWHGLDFFTHRAIPDGHVVTVSSQGDNEAIIQKAIDNEGIIGFSYNGEDREIEPEKVTSASGNKLVVGWDYDRSDYRTFRLDRIEGPVNVV